MYKLCHGVEMETGCDKPVDKYGKGAKTQSSSKKDQCHTPQSGDGQGQVPSWCFELGTHWGSLFGFLDLPHNDSMNDSTQEAKKKKGNCNLPHLHFVAGSLHFIFLSQRNILFHLN